MKGARIQTSVRTSVRTSARTSVGTSVGTSVRTAVQTSAYGLRYGRFRRPYGRRFRRGTVVRTEDGTVVHTDDGTAVRATEPWSERSTEPRADDEKLQRTAAFAESGFLAAARAAGRLALYHSAPLRRADQTATEDNAGFDGAAAHEFAPAPGLGRAPAGAAPGRAPGAPPAASRPQRETGASETATEHGTAAVDTTATEEHARDTRGFAEAPL